MRPVGRLDMYSEGLLLFTNDGNLPSGWSTLPGMRRNIWSGLTAAAPDPSRCFQGPHEPGWQATGTGVGWRLCPRERESVLLRFVIHEGRNRQIRRMASPGGGPVPGSNASGKEAFCWGI